MYFVVFFLPLTPTPWPYTTSRPIQFRCRYINLLGARFRFRVSSAAKQKVERGSTGTIVYRSSSNNSSLLTGASNSIAWHDIRVGKKPSETTPTLPPPRVHTTRAYMYITIYI